MSGDPIFEPKPVASMQTHAVNGALALGLAQAAKIPFQIASLLLLPRLLEPIDYGIYAMVDPLVSFASLLLAFGLTQALIQAPRLERAEMSGLFWILVIVGCASAAVMAAASPLVAALYNEPRVAAVTAVSSLFLVIAGFSNIPESILNRQMKFGWIAGISLAGTAVGLIVSLISAMMGAHYWALTLGYLTTSLVTLAGVWIGAGWAPREAPRFRGLMRYFKFGGAVMAADAATLVSRDLDNVLIGRYVGGVQLGFYDRGNKLAIIPTQRIGTVLQSLMLPILSRLNADAARYRRAYIRVIRQLMLFLAPGTVAVAATAPVLIPFLIGERWAPAAPIFAWLALAALHRPVSGTMNLLFISQGRTRGYMIWSGFSAVTSVLSFVIGLRWGAVGVAAAFALSDVLVRLPFLWWWVTREGPIRQHDLYAAAAPFAAAAAGTFVALLALQHFPFPNALTHLVVCAIAAYAVFCALLTIFQGGRAAMSDTMHLWRTELPRLAPRPFAGRGRGGGAGGSSSGENTAVTPTPTPPRKGAGSDRCSIHPSPPLRPTRSKLFPPRLQPQAPPQAENCTAPIRPGPAPTRLPPSRS